MNCKTCPFNVNSLNYNVSLLKNVAEDLQNLFTCSEQAEKNNNSNKRVCPAMLWVIVYIGSKDDYSLCHAVEALSDLVELGQSELVCALFENSPYETRRKLWQTMTEKYSNRMYMFNPLLEREELELPETSANTGKMLPIWQHYLLYGKHQPALAYQWS